MSGLNRLSATAMARQLATREISAVSLLRDCLERIAEREPTVHAWTVIDGDAAMERARMLDSQASAGLLHGVPIAVKDLIDTFDMPTCYGSPIYANHRPAADLGHALALFVSGLQGTVAGGSAAIVRSIQATCVEIRQEALTVPYLPMSSASPVENEPTPAR